MAVASKSACLGKDGYIQLPFCNVAFVPNEAKYRLLQCFSGEDIRGKKAAIWVRAGPALPPLVVIFVVCMAYPSTFLSGVDPVYFFCPPTAHQSQEWEGNR